MTRSVWKGPFVDGFLLKKAEKSRSSGRNEIIKIWSRRSTIRMLGEQRENHCRCSR